MSVDELVVRVSEQGVLNPGTGTIVSRDSTDEEIAELLLFLAEAKRRVEAVSREVSGWMLERMDVDARWTREAGGYVLSGASPTAGGKWDERRLETVLASLRQRGQISDDAAQRCWITKRTVSTRGVNAILATLSTVDVDLVRSCRTATSRSVTVK